MSLETLFKKAQLEAGPAIWSQGVIMTRDGSQFFEEAHSQETERIFQVLVKGEKVSPRVLLWPEDEDWDCDCNGDSPCAHVAGTLIALKQNLVKKRSAAPGEKTAAANSLSLEYHFRRSPRGLTLERFLTNGERKKPLTGSVRAYVAAFEAGRIQSPPIVANRADFEVDAILSSSGGAQLLNRLQLTGLFKVFIFEQKFFLDDQSIQVSSEFLKGLCELVDEGTGYRLRRVKNPTVTEVFPLGVALCTDTLKLITENRLSDEEMRKLSGEGLYFSPEQENFLRTHVLPDLEKKVPIDIKSLKLPQLLVLEPRLDFVTEYSTGGELEVLAKVVYGEPALAELNPASFELVASAQTAQRKAYQSILRNKARERQLIQRLGQELNLGLGRRLNLRGTEAIEMSQKLKRFGVEAAPLQKFAVQSAEAWQLNVDYQNGVCEFSLQSSDGEKKIAFEDLHRAWQGGERHVSLMDGGWVELPKTFMDKHARRLADFLAARDPYTKKIPLSAELDLMVLCEDMSTAMPQTLRDRKDQFAAFAGLPPLQVPADLQVELRDYQKQGVRWLNFVRDISMGALLADDMGLGKTLQSLCVLRGRSLVVAPTSVLRNWENECRRFRPQLKVHFYHGSQRRFPENLEDNSLLLTSYGLLRSDIDQISGVTWDTALLDEAQTLKNPDSQIAQAAFKLRANFKVALSGTPIENRIDDLWSQFQFLNPGLLGERRDFREKFQAEPSRWLRARIRPFILRRLKKDVAKELPPRIENILNCELGAEERELYEAIMGATRQDIVSKLQTGGSVMEALELLLRIRQACCHPALLPGQAASFGDMASSKVQLLVDSLQELLAEGHKVLVFSQWTSFLDIIQRHIKKSLDEDVLRIDGGTTQRQSVVDKFQNEPHARVLLISLKAGGVGLNLTAADHVFIMDPWWNPAVERQAADRAHRIGQKNTVMIHKLVTLNSVEEKIVALQEKKKDLAESILEGSGTAAAELSRDDLLELLN